ncbi:MAG: hypothetical protein JWM93_379 [Frankiales bacterium]|nr:hypothetical protein [Frankiales bacterium]
MPTTITYACHIAHLDAMSGVGVLIRPRPADDLRDPCGGASLHARDWNAVMRDLALRGWEPSEDDDGGLCHVGYTADGLDAVALYGHEPLTAPATIWDEAIALADVLRAAGVG